MASSSNSTLDRAEHRRILAKYVRLLDVPIRVVVSAEQQVRWAHLLHLVEVFTPPIGPAKLDAFAAEVESETDCEESNPDDVRSGLAGAAMPRLAV